MAFGERLQEVRKRSGLTQEEFAEQLQVSRQSVSRWESGRGYPEMEKIIFICNRFGHLGLVVQHTVGIRGHDSLIQHLARKGPCCDERQNGYDQ